MAETISLYEAISRNVKDLYVKGVPTESTATSFNSNSFIHRLPNQLAGKDVYIYSGVGAGQARMIGSFVPASRKIITEPSWDTAPTATSKYLIFDYFKVEDYENAVNRGIDIARLNYLQEMVATMQLVATQYEYPVPSGMKWVHSLKFVPSGNSDYGADDEVSRIFELHSNIYTIELNPLGTYIIALDRRKVDLGNFDNEWMRVGGQGRYDFVATQMPADLEAFIVAHASMQLSAQKSSLDQSYKLLYQMFREDIKGSETKPGLESYIYRYGRGKQVGL